MSVTTVPAYSAPIAYGAGEPLKTSLLMLSLEYGSVNLWLAYSLWAAAKAKAFRSESLAVSV